MLEGILIVLILILDRVSKVMTARYLALGESYPLINGVLQLTNVHNRGAVWGIMQGKRTLFLIITPVVCVLVLIFLFKKRKELTVLGRITLALVFAGAVGNLYDRFFQAYVQDMIDFCLISFPVFNVADSAITVACFLLVIDALVHRRNSVLDVLDGMLSKKSAESKTEPVGKAPATAEEMPSREKEAGTETEDEASV